MHKIIRTPCRIKKKDHNRQIETKEAYCCLKTIFQPLNGNLMNCQFRCASVGSTRHVNEHSSSISSLERLKEHLIQFDNNLDNNRYMRFNKISINLGNFTNNNNNELQPVRSVFTTSGGSVWKTIGSFFFIRHALLEVIEIRSRFESIYIYI